MQRIALAVEYDGSHYHGWQRQPVADSIQARLEHALATVAARPVSLVCAGRTDAGVHASHQIIHFDTDAERPEVAWLLGGVQVLPPDISLLWARVMSPDFHARFSATARSYRYILLNRVTRSALHAGRVTWWRHPLDAEAMHEAAQCLVGEHDFSSFRARDCQSNTPWRCIESIRVRRFGDFVALDITANAFLHHMVRNIVGTLLPVGAGKWPVSAVAEILARRQREAAGMTAPPDGLYLADVRYPAHFGIAEPLTRPTFWPGEGGLTPETPVPC
ncbi:tRNA pseudouridine(38-40) synthase TruA [Halothiobacillus sp. DCM-1]|uniref:tRNA pseudouridine(38-40) synthase TruA n=1 Tax=Halothiobacillus sp. DCM-1 TaxID=3112558 RepID=UPI00324C2D9B